MDDPWGSPWASTDTGSKIDNDPPSSSRANIFLSPPPKAFFGNGASLSPQSPWSGNHDDSGLNIWSPTTTRADDTDQQNEWSAWADSAVQPPPRLSPRLSTSGKESPLAWPENAAASPVFIPNSRSRTPSILRHHSPDPWAAEPSLTNRSDVDLPNSIKRKASNASAIGLEQVGGATQASPAVAESRGVESANSKNAPVDEASTTRQDDHPPSSRELASKHANANSHLDLAARAAPSRSSSTCTTNSHDGPDRQDSPITSIDEDRGGRMRNSSRKVSGKVQELVGVYDGLARAASEEPPNLGRRRLSQTAYHENSLTRDELEEDDEDGGVGFGDFEDPLVDRDRVASSRNRSSSSELSSTPKAEPRDSSNHTHENEGEKGDVIVTEAEPARAQKLPNRFRGLNFDTNLSTLDELFPSLPDSLASCAMEDQEISDHVVRDSFSTISERKAWYRISRFGSMRKHNSGDDENYHRATWPTSQLHTDTVKIVRRWMEQDTYAGRATLGGRGRTGFFDWDSDAAPVDLDQVFRRKKSLTKHARTASIPATNAAAFTEVANERSYRNSTGISLPSALPAANQSPIPAASFEWNSGAREASLPNGSAPNNDQVLEPGAGSVPVLQTTLRDENDDDWGEMVSSPRATQDHMELNATAFQPPETQTTDPKPGRRPSLTKSDIHHATEPSPKAPQDTLIVSDPWSSFDISALEKPNPISKLPTEQTSQSIVIPSDPRPNTPPLNRGSFELKNGAMKHETLGGNTITSQRATSTASTRTSVSTSLRGDEIQDDIVVQKILKHLPDLSYMFR